MYHMYFSVSVHTFPFIKKSLFEIKVQVRLLDSSFISFNSFSFFSECPCEEYYNRAQHYCKT